MAKSNTNSLLEAYLILGEDDLKRQRVLKRLRTRVGSPEDLEFNHDEFDGANASGSAIAAACNTLPFASSLRLVEVKNGQDLKKDDQEVLVAYLSAPCPSTVLAFSCEKLAKNTRLYKAFAALGKDAIIDCAPMKRFELVRAIRSMATGYGFTLTEPAAVKLIELVGEDTIHLDGELQKLSLTASAQSALTDQDIERLVARTSQAKPWEFVNAISERNLRKSLSLLGLLEDPPLRLVALCTTRLRELACAKSLEERGQSLLLAETLGVPAWRVKNHSQWAAGFTKRELAEGFTSIMECERLLKTSSQDRSVLVDWIIGFLG